MALDIDKLLGDIKDYAQPELEKLANDLRSQFLTEFDDYLDSSNVHKFDDLLKKAAKYEIDAVMSTDRNEAEQYATAAEDVLRQVQLLLIAEQIVASREVASMLESAAKQVWSTFKVVAGGVLNTAVKGALAGALGGTGGGQIAGLVDGFLGEALEGLVGGSD